MFFHQLADGVTFGPLEPWQAEEFAAAVDRAREHLRPWVPFGTRVVDADSARELLQRMANKRAEDTGGMFGIWVDGVLMGGTLFRSWDSKLGVCELGVWLDPSVEGRGLVYAAATHMIDYAVRVRGMQRVSGNARARISAARRRRPG
jgi:RimJ/RimL family protein N-acetyltransferase